MQISGLPITTTFPAQTQRSDTVERVEREARRDESRNKNDRAIDELSNPKLSDETLRLQRVELANELEKISARSNLNEDIDLPLNTRQALKAFVENAPSAEQQLGIELVGVDTFA